MKNTLPELGKMERMLEEAHYVLRYEKGSFQSGYCILEDRKVVVLNKFLQTEGRIQTLTAIVPLLSIAAEALSDEARNTFHRIMEQADRPAVSP